MNTKQIWQATLGDLQLRVPREAFDTWIRPATLVALEDDRAVIRAPNIFVRNRIATHYYDQLAATLSAVVGRPLCIEVVTERSGAGKRP